MDAAHSSGGRGQAWCWISLLAALAVWAGLLAPASAFALPPFDGSMSFGLIDGPEDPEEFSWEVTLGDGQELKSVDDQHAAVYYESGVQAFAITALMAHDAVGATVPTSLGVSGTNVVALTVHHHAGNPAAGGAPFDYPISEGVGWKGGFSTVLIDGPPDEKQLQTERERREAEERLRHEMLEGCRVPSLHGRSLKASAKRLRNAGCKLGKVRGDRSRSGKVVRQDVRTGSILPTGSAISVKLGIAPTSTAANRVRSEPANR